MDSAISETGAPPKVDFRLRIGVTGHRSELLGDSLTAIEARIDQVIADVVTIARRLAVEQAEYFAPGLPVFTLVSPLADGVDQVAARLALQRGLALWAVLPFPPDDYQTDFVGTKQREDFQSLFGRAERVLELPGERSESLHAYLMAGRATIAHCDLMIAVWDGKPPRGRGGTGEIVEIALHEGRPIIHIPVDPEMPVRLLWSAFDPHVSSHRRDAQFAGRTYGVESLETLLKALVEPPLDPCEREYLSSYYGEHERRWSGRIEYSLLLAVTGVSRIRFGDVRRPSYAKAIRDEWAQFGAGCAASGGKVADLQALQRAYCWSDLLARHFAQTYRSGHVFNFVLGAVAVLLALSSLLVHDAKMPLALAELAVIAAIIINTSVGVRHGWHRRWLDYRNLAERLRPMRSLKLLAIAAPGSSGAGGAKRWVEWYANGIWRALGMPEGRLADPGAIVRTLVTEELEPQIAYHRLAAHRAETLDHRLHLIGTGLFIASIIGCLVVVAGIMVAPDWVKEHSKLFVALSAGLPALGTAISGIRVQGDFSGTSLRSSATADKLEAIAAEVGAGIGLSRAADLFERGADAMLEDLGEWRLAHRQRELVIP